MANPLRDDSPAVIKLKAPPLERVLGVVAFSPVLKIGDPSGSGIADFQERVRQAFPALELEQENSVQFQLAPDGSVLPPIMTLNPVWRFYDKEREWRLSLTTRSIALETQRQYQCRDDLVTRLAFLAEAVKEAFRPTEMTRIGFRYLNVFGQTKLSRLAEFVRPEFAGFGVPPYLEQLQQATAVSHFSVPEGTLVIKNGTLTAGMMHEFMIGPVSEPKWYLDLDVWTDLSIPFEQNILIAQSKVLTSRICSVFRWVITPKFMEVYGADG